MTSYWFHLSQHPVGGALLPVLVPVHSLDILLAVSRLDVLELLASLPG